MYSTVGRLFQRLSLERVIHDAKGEPSRLIGHATETSMSVFYDSCATVGIARFDSIVSDLPHLFLFYLICTSVDVAV